MHMEALNVASTFVAMTMKLQVVWDTLTKERGLKIFQSKIIVVDVLLYESKAEQLLAYFRTVLGVLK